MQANAVRADYLARHNRRFAVLPADRPAESILYFRHERMLAADGTFTIGGRELMLSGNGSATWRGRRLEIQERLDGSLWATFEGLLADHPGAEATGRLARLTARLLEATARPSMAGRLLPPSHHGAKVAGGLSGQDRWPPTRK